VQKKYFTLIPVLLFLISVTSCTKIDTTTVGSDLLPAVDNVTTFADTLLVNGTQGIFTDDTKLNAFDNHLIGAITNDPVFGNQRSNLYVEFKPNKFPYSFTDTTATVDNLIGPSVNSGFDSVVLCLSVQGFYGDSTKPQSFSVYQIGNSTSNFKDSAYKLNFLPDGGNGRFLGSKTVIAQDLKNFTRRNLKVKDSINGQVNYQIRIKLDNNLLADFIQNTDTSATSTQMFRSDSYFKDKLKGFAIVADQTSGSNCLIYTKLGDAKSGLEIYFRKKLNTSGTLDTSYVLFPFNRDTTVNKTVSLAAHACNYVKDITAAEFPNNPQGDALYIQSTPGTYALLNIPQLSNRPNSIIHRAELIIEQIPSSNAAIAAIDNVLAPPSYLYLDLKDSGTQIKYKPVYIDLNPNAVYNPDNAISYLPANYADGIDYAYFGGFLRKKTDVVGNTINYYNFNITRYVQQIVTNKINNYTLRISAPYNLTYYGITTGFKNSLGFGRIKIGNGNNANYKLRLRIVYSKI
jgi:hypothetical protein